MIRVTDVLGVLGVLGESLGFLAAVVAFKGVAHGFDTAVRVGACLDRGDIAIVGVDTSKHLAVLGNHIANRNSALILAANLTVSANLIKSNTYVEQLPQER